MPPLCTVREGFTGVVQYLHTSTRSPWTLDCVIQLRFATARHERHMGRGELGQEERVAQRSTPAPGGACLALLSSWRR